MTLDTRVYVRGQIGYREVFVKCNQLLGADEGVRFSDKDGDIGNEPAQGLPAWLIVYHGNGKPLRVPGDHAKYCDGEADECFEPCGVPCWVEVSLDTAYGYQDDNGGCGDLHARLVAELGRWLDDKGIRWSWRNEFTGEVHWGYEGLTGLGSGGAQASAWFRDIVAPALGLDAS